MGKYRKIRAIISGGGTGGHIFPALSIANKLRELNPETEILFVGAEGRMEMERVPAAGYEIVGLPVAGLQRKLTLSNLALPFKVIRSIRIAKKVIREFRPDIAIGVGGYASAPLLWPHPVWECPPLYRNRTDSPDSLTRFWERMPRRSAWHMKEWRDSSRLTG